MDVFTKVRGVNKTDAVTLVSTFGSVKRAVNARPEEVIMISGWGQQKVARLERAVGEGFRVGKRKGAAGNEAVKKRMAKAGADADGVAARLGIGSGAATSARTQVPQAWVVEDDDDALAAVAEFEAAEEVARLRMSMVREGSSRPEKEKDDVDEPGDDNAAAVGFGKDAGEEDLGN